MKNLICSILLSVAFYSAFCQTQLDLYTQRMLKHAPSEKTSISLFVRGDVQAVKEAVQQVKGNYKLGYGDYSSVEIPLSQLDVFLRSPAVRGVENGERKMVALTDTAIIVNCVKPIHDGDFPLDTSYLGDGIIIGIIDFGIDINHQDFKDTSGDTRILYLWDQNIPADSLSPAPYDYGRECTAAQINAGQCTHAEPGSAGHGTNVAGIAAGNGRSCNGRYVGMAPNTDIIFVAFNFNQPFISSFIDAVDYVFKKADSLGKPCVINASLGYYWGAHDDLDPGGHFVNSMLEAKSGRSLVCAAGNAGNLDFHLGYDITTDTSFTWFQYNPQFQDVYFDFWADTQDFNDVYFAIGTDNPATWENLRRTPFFNVFDSTFAFGIVSGDTVALHTFQMRDSTNNFLGNVTIEIWMTEGRYNIEVHVENIQHPSHYWSFITMGTGRIDGWNDAAPSLAIYASDMVTTLPDSTLRPDITHYKLPDTEQNITSGFSCSEKVIAVGNFTNRKSLLNCDSAFTVNTSNPGEIFFTSSHGPTRRGLTKPDISATGDFTVAARNANIPATNAISGYCPGGGCYYRRNGGTSMASPVVAGIAALYLQKHPDANWRQVRDAILLTAKTDSFTGAVPNNIYGNGKVSGCDAMMLTVVYGCTDTAAFNYDSLATVEDGSCIPRAYGCTDSTALNYNPTANTDDSSCIPRVYGCMDSTALNYNPAANTDDGTCIPVIYGCMDSSAINYNPDANTPDSCIYPAISGCTDSSALNYDSTATVDDGSCLYVGISSIDNQKIKLAFIPNFFRDETQIIYDFENALNARTSIVVSNLLGQTIDEIVLPQQKGTILYHPSSQEAGVYFYHLVSEGKTLLSGKVVRY